MYVYKTYNEGYRGYLLGENMDCEGARLTSWDVLIFLQGWIDYTCSAVYVGGEGVGRSMEGEEGVGEEDVSGEEVDRSMEGVGVGEEDVGGEEVGRYGRKRCGERGCGW